jgi:hypothetical protein
MVKLSARSAPSPAARPAARTCPRTSARLSKPNRSRSSKLTVICPPPYAHPLVPATGGDEPFSADSNVRTIGAMTSEDITVIQIVKGSDGGAKWLSGLSAAQKAGDACIVCGAEGDVTEHIGYVDGRSVKVHMRCAAQWRYGTGQRG